MADNNQLPANMDLDAILRTLASLPKPEDQQHQQTQHHPQPPNQYLPHPPSADPRLAGRSLPPPKPQARTSTPLVDPATIIDWKQGLRCVSKIAAQNPHFAVSVRKLIKDQEGNVKQWEAGRQRLIDEQALKRENEHTHRAALSLPGLLDNTPLLCTPEREQQDLALYDAKVYRATKAMVESQASALKGLGVPFFGVRPCLLASEGEEVSGGDEGQKKKITSEQVRELQRRMLVHLMDLYGD